MSELETGNIQSVESPDINPVACRDLWAAVIFEQFRLAQMPAPNFANTHLDIQRAREWFGCRDFHTVCALAGVDGDWVYLGFLRKMHGVQVVT